MDLYTDFTLVRSMLGSKTSPFPVCTPCRGARGSEAEYYGLCARSHYYHHPGVPIYNYGWCYRHRHCCTVTCSQNSLSHLTHAGTQQRLAVPSLLPVGGVCSQQGSPAHQELPLAGPVSFCPNRTEYSSSSALLLKSLSDPSPFLLSLSSPLPFPQAL